MKGGLTTINSLHPEILVLIFSLVLDAITRNRGDIEATYRHAKLKKIITLSSVCMYWRHIALNHSAFWNYIPIFFTSQSIQYSLDGASVWLDRARATPLDVFIETRDPEKTRLPKLPESTLVSALLKTPFSGKKIQTLSLTLWSTIHFDSLVENWLSAGVCDTLTKLEISLGDLIGDSFQNWLSQCQELQSLSLNAGPLYDDSFPLLPKLAELELTSFGSPITALELANILRSCPNLRKLTLEDMNIEATNDVDITPVSLPHLSVLAFTELDATHILPIFSSNSNSLSLSIASTLPDETRGSLIDRISQLSRLSTITDLWLSVGDLEMHELRGLIYSLPHLQKLWLHDIQLDGPKAWALRGVDELGEIPPPTFPVPRAISLVESDIEDEVALRWLVSLHPLQQLKLDSCLLMSSESGSILEANELHRFLLRSVPDLTVVDRKK